MAGSWDDILYLLDPRLAPGQFSPKHHLSRNWDNLFEHPSSDVIEELLQNYPNTKTPPSYSPKDFSYTKYPKLAFCGSMKTLQKKCTQI